MCTLLADRYNLHHFSVGGELRSLVSSNPTGPAAHIKAKFSTSEPQVFAQNVRAGALGPAPQTPKYIKERVFPDDINS
jgi:hypothetical protein